MRIRADPYVHPGRRDGERIEAPAQFDIPDRCALRRVVRPAFAGAAPRDAAHAVGHILQSGTDCGSAVLAGQATFIFAFFGAGLDSVIAAHEATYETCVAAGGGDCRVNFEPASLLTPTLVGALVGLGLLALVPVLAKRIWWRQADAGSQAENSR